MFYLSVLTFIFFEIGLIKEICACKLYCDEIYSFTLVYLIRNIDLNDFPCLSKEKFYKKN